MKYLAVLKDSLREAIDLKIFYVTVGLSLLISLLVGTTTLSPVPMEEALTSKLWFWNALILKNKNPEGEKWNVGEASEIAVSDVKRTNEGNEPWTGDYTFVLTFKLREPPQPQLKPQAGDQPPMPTRPTKLNPTTVSLLVFGLFPWFNQTDAKKLDIPEADALSFEVQTKGIKPEFRTRQTWYHVPGFFFGLGKLDFLGNFTLAEIVNFIANFVIGTWGAGTIMLLGTIMTAFFIPNMMARGTVDLLLVRPIHRSTLFAYKFLGGMSFMVLNAAIIMVGIWLAVGIQAGLWVKTYLLCIAIYTFEFAIFYSVSALVGVLTRSAIVSILVVMMFWALLVAVGWVHNWYGDFSKFTGNVDTLSSSADEPWYVIGIDAVHAALPHYKDIDWLTAKAIKSEMLAPTDMSKTREVEAYREQIKALDKQYAGYSWTTSLAVSSAFIVIVSGLAMWVFAARDY
jgi:hypothetical protein